MKVYVLKRILSVIPVLFVVSLVVFFIIHLTPGDPAAVILGEEASQEQIDELRKNLGLDLPLYHQYMSWISGVLQGDMGVSYFTKEPVNQAIYQNIGPTLSLTLLSQTIALIVAIPFGIMAAKHQGTVADRSLMGFTLLGLSIPNFILGLLLVLLFSVSLGWLPVAGYKPLSSGIWEHIKYLIMPAIALGTVIAALITRMTRSSMLEVLNENYIRTARAKGVRERNVIFKHALRNAFMPILTVIGQTFGGLVAGAVVTETIFNIPGIGQLIVNSIARRDLAVIQGVVLYITVAYVFINLLVDLLYGVIDPRVRLDKK